MTNYFINQHYFIALNNLLRLKRLVHDFELGFSLSLRLYICSHSFYLLLGVDKKFTRSANRFL
jgi:hypothetical protein